MTPTDTDFIILLVTFWLVAPCLGLLIANWIRRKTQNERSEIMKTVEKNKLTPPDLDRVCRAFKILSAIGTTPGANTHNLYPEEIRSTLDTSINSLVSLFNKAK